VARLSATGRGRPDSASPGLFRPHRQVRTELVPGSGRRSGPRNGGGGGRDPASLGSFVSLSGHKRRSGYRCDTCPQLPFGYFRHPRRLGYRLDTCPQLPVDFRHPVVSLPAAPAFHRLHVTASIASVSLPDLSHVIQHVSRSGFGTDQCDHAAAERSATRVPRLRSIRLRDHGSEGLFRPHGCVSQPPVPLPGVHARPLSRLGSRAASSGRSSTNGGPTL